METDINGHINDLLKSIEDSLQWGESSQWSSYDFEKLTDLIHERTGILISSNTLKRVWGRIKYESSPSRTTLNTLSRFLDFTDFREFKSTGGAKKPEPEKVPKKHFKIQWPPLKSRPSVIFASGAVFMLVAVIALSYSSREEKLSPDDFYFTSRKVTQGLPNSVIFEYRAKKAPSDAKIEIQQSWDSKKRQVVSKADSLATSMYYDPGYFKAKLVINGQVVKEHGVLIPSEGWKAKIESKERTLYFKDSSVTGSGKVAVDERLLEQDGIYQNTTPITTNFRYVEDFKDLRVNDLLIETKFRNTTENNTNLCQKSSITLLMEGEAIKIPFSRIGCISELELWHLDEYIKGKNNDLSKLSVDFGDWVTIKLRLKKDWLTVNINGNKSLELPMKGRINRFHGLIYRFEGTGEIKSLLLKNSEKTYLEWPQPQSGHLAQNRDYE